MYSHVLPATKQYHYNWIVCLIKVNRIKVLAKLTAPIATIRSK